MVLRCRPTGLQSNRSRTTALVFPIQPTKAAPGGRLPMATRSRLSSFLAKRCAKSIDNDAIGDREDSDVTRQPAEPPPSSRHLPATIYRFDHADVGSGRAKASPSDRSPHRPCSTRAEALDKSHTQGFHHLSYFGILADPNNHFPLYPITARCFKRNLERLRPANRPHGAVKCVVRPLRSISIICNGKSSYRTYSKYGRFVLEQHQEHRLEIGDSQKIQTHDLYIQRTPSYLFSLKFLKTSLRYNTCQDEKLPILTQKQIYNVTQIKRPAQKRKDGKRRLAWLRKKHWPVISRLCSKATEVLAVPSSKKRCSAACRPTRSTCT